MVSTVKSEEHSYIVVIPDRDLLQGQNYNSCLDVPCIFDEDWVYQSKPSRYLRQRQLLRTPVCEQKYSRRRIPTPISMRNFAYWLCNFLEWIAIRKKKWRSLRFVEDILFGYQAEMLNGKWSSKGTPLAPRTINCRVGVACDYLAWTAQAGYRKDFVIGTHPINVPIASSTQTAISNVWEKESRDGTVRIPPSYLRMPSDIEVKQWLEGVERRWGYVKCLMCRLIIATAIRREECAQWQLDTLPLNRSDWHVIGSQVKVDVCYGAKGTKVTLDNGLTIGPERQVFLPLILAEEIDAYRKLKRVQLQAKHVRGGKTQEERLSRKLNASTRLFLSEKTGTAISAQTLYNAWTDVSPLPFKRWHPHLGRHYWVCKKLVQRCLPVLDENGKQLVKYNGHDDLKSSVQDVIALEVKPQLGHVSAKSSEAYMKWMQQLVNLPSIYDQYQDNLENIVDR